MSGAPTLRLSLADQRTLLRAARGMDDPWGSTLELSILTLALPGEVVAIEIERIDWNRGIVPVPARGGVERPLALSREAQRAVLRIAGAAGGTGQVVTAGRGHRLRAPLFRLDRLLDRLAVAAPETIRLAAWNFHGLRAEAADLLAQDGADRAEVDAVIGRQPPNAKRAEGRTIRDRSGSRRGLRLRGDANLASLGAERWARLLLDTGAMPHGDTGGNR